MWEMAGIGWNTVRWVKLCEIVVVHVVGGDIKRRGGRGMCAELISILRSFRRYELGVLGKLERLSARGERRRTEQETARAEQEMADLRENLREARLQLVRILSEEVRWQLREITEG